MCRLIYFPFAYVAKRERGRQDNLQPHLGIVMKLLRVSSIPVWEKCGLIVLWVLVLLLSLSGKCTSDPNYLIGLGSYDITGVAADVNMMGFANIEQITSGLHFRPCARTFIVAEPGPQGTGLLL